MAIDNGGLVGRRRDALALRVECKGRVGAENDAEMVARMSVRIGDRWDEGLMEELDRMVVVRCLRLR